MTRDALLEHAARLHYDAAARAEARARRAEPPRPDLEDARERTIASIFERRYGVPLADALEVGLPIPVESEEGHLRVERTLLRAGLALAVVDDGHWLYETSSTVVYLRHYARERALDLYAPVHEFSGTDPRSQDAIEAYLRANGGSIGGAFWGICTFERAGDHVCACARLSTAELTVPAVRYAVESVLHLVSTVESDVGARACPRARRSPTTPPSCRPPRTTCARRCRRSTASRARSSASPRRRGRVPASSRTSSTRRRTWTVCSGHLSLLARIGDGRFAPVPVPIDAADLASRAAEGGAGERGADADAATVQAAADEAVEAIVLLATCTRRLDPAHATLTVCANGPAVVLTGVADEVVPFLGAGPGARDLALSTSLVTLRALGATIDVADGAAHVTFPTA